MSNRVWRGGMIGAGAWSEVQLTAWAGVNNAEIVALCDRHPERREPIVDRFNISQVCTRFLIAVIFRISSSCCLHQRSYDCL